MSFDDRLGSDAGLIQSRYKRCLVLWADQSQHVVLPQFVAYNSCVPLNAEY